MNQSLRTGSHDLPVPPALRDFMAQGWDQPAPSAALDRPVPQGLGARRQRLADALPGRRIVVASGRGRTRSNDQEYRFRPHSAHTWLTGNHASDAVLVLDGGDATLYLRPAPPRDTDEFWRDRTYGDFWAGRRPTLAETSERLGLTCRDLDALPEALGRAGRPLVALRGQDPLVDDLVGPGPQDGVLAAVLDELRLVKDAWELEQVQAAVDATVRGFGDCVREWPEAVRHGEAWIDGTFYRRARVDGYDVGYNSIVASGPHATTLHWIENNGRLADGDLVLLDMGVETRSLYTADITRTIPVSGRFTPLQRDLYSIVLQAQDAGIATLRPGAAFREFHHAAAAVLATGLHDLGVLRCSVQEALDPSSTLYRRWTLCGTGHMLGMDVHDCAAAPAGTYLDGVLAEGHVLTVEPGLYLQAEDTLLPPELRGIGIRIEDDFVITATGSQMLSSSLPRSADDIESWMAAQQR